MLSSQSSHTDPSGVVYLIGRYYDPQTAYCDQPHIICSIIAMTSSPR
jgi:hypothetical protein